ncbi:hypothetical protein QFZ42_004382 [Variovorax paradoxus]|nr:hypothetical protein [Variovorax paradoxus]
MALLSAGALNQPPDPAATGLVAMPPRERTKAGDFQRWTTLPTFQPYLWQVAETLSSISVTKPQCWQAYWFRPVR